MKKTLAFVFATLLMVIFFSSCRSHQSCPAYKNGSAQITTHVESSRV